MNFKHISKDLPDNLDLPEKEFIPKVPDRTCENEDITQRRICVCPTIKDAINAFPYKEDIVNWHMKFYKDTYLAVYDINTNDYISDKELNGLVPDVHITKEHWILNPFKIKPQMLKIKDMKLEHYNMYLNKHYGFLKKLEYEMDTVNYDRTEEFIFLSKNLYNKFVKIANELCMSIELIEDKHIHLQTFYFIETTKKYRWIKVKVFVPAGVSLSKLWLLNNNQNKFALRKKILFEEYKEFDIELIHGLNKKDFE